MKRLVIVADHPMVVQAIRLALRQTAGFQVVALLDGRRSVAGALGSLDPDVVLVDEMSQPELALERLRELSAETSDAKVLLLTARMDAAWIDGAFEAGAQGAICKTVHPVALGTLLRETARGNVVLRHAPAAAVVEQPHCELTERELEVLRLVAEGQTNGAIARELWVTQQTVKFHLSNTYRKLGVANRTQASRYAYANDLLATREPIAS